jgi:hypothetical protein
MHKTKRRKKENRACEKKKRAYNVNQGPARHNNNAELD